MLYLAIDQHSKQITVSVRNTAGDTVLERQVCTRPEKIQEFFEQLVAKDKEFMAILECCGFNDWLIEQLRKWNCCEIVLIHPGRPSKRKTDRRDARMLCDLLWLNRERLAAGERIHGLRRVYIARGLSLPPARSSTGTFSTSFISPLRLSSLNGTLSPLLRSA